MTRLSDYFQNIHLKDFKSFKHDRCSNDPANPGEWKEGLQKATMANQFQKLHPNWSNQFQYSARIKSALGMMNPPSRKLFHFFVSKSALKSRVFESLGFSLQSAA